MIFGELTDQPLFTPYRERKPRFFVRWLRIDNQSKSSIFVSKTRIFDRVVKLEKKEKTYFIASRGTRWNKIISSSFKTHLSRCFSSLCKVRVTSQRELLDYGHLIIKSSEPSLFKSPDEESPGIIQENAGLEAEVQGAMPGSSKGKRLFVVIHIVSTDWLVKVKDKTNRWKCGRTRLLDQFRGIQITTVVDHVMQETVSVTIL